MLTGKLFSPFVFFENNCLVYFWMHVIIINLKANTNFICNWLNKQPETPEPRRRGSGVALGAADTTLPVLRGGQYRGSLILFSHIA